MNIKICGITALEEVQALNSLKPDYIGLVFAESKRKISKEQGKLLYDSIDRHIKVVGVFRNNTKRYISEILDYIPLDALQLHGDEDNDFIEYFRKKYKCEIWKGTSIRTKEDIEKATTFNVDTLILDGSNPGSGEVFPWELVINIEAKAKIFLAGGINEDNVLQGINKLNIHGVDVSSGVEVVKDGKRSKDAVKMQKLIKKVRECNERKI
ncbi:phosphoribosylanthranilate isomerase [Clostridium vincentii]|uniref:N-(5'-phosphoribosyl)anthranilate isomerase n=1 Tax=Clostridium vincentii TaxID=52704 RepID=A0A2T0BBG6_9CLOT|nr:phosphoribosylanthranilate isomerase [Clostridium vincentii]PRR81241.1 N-(5'-phosphoribosyl)anthranilate isomerase [Clostridium vincentii]